MISLHRQSGAVLVVAMLILPLLLVLGVLAMNSSFFGLKMVDARAVRGESNILLHSASNEILDRPNSELGFASATTTTSNTFSYEDVEATVVVNSDVGVPCKRSANASSIDFECKYLQVDFVHTFGRMKTNGKKWAENAMSVGIEQPYIAD